jgi:hypothetical protein
MLGLGYAELELPHYRLTTGTSMSPKSKTMPFVSELVAGKLRLLLIAVKLCSTQAWRF